MQSTQLQKIGLVREKVEDLWAIVTKGGRCLQEIDVGFRVLTIIYTLASGSGGGE